MAESIEFWQPGERITAIAEAAVTGGRFVAISDPMSGGLPVVSLCGAAAKAFGVAMYDAAIAGRVTVHSAPGAVVPVTAGANLTAGQEVESNATGQAIVLASGKPLGLCLDTVLSGADAPIKLY